MTLTRDKLVLVGIVVAVVLAVVLVDWLHVSATERVEQTIRAAAAAVAARDIEALMGCVSVDYDDGNMKRDALRRTAERFFDRYDPSSVRVSTIRAKVSRPMATAEVVVRGDMGQGDSYGRTLWRLELISEEPKVWRITRVKLVEIGAQNVEGWGSIPGGMLD